jgi:hypothetical protein
MVVKDGVRQQKKVGALALWTLHKYAQSIGELNELPSHVCISVASVCVPGGSRIIGKLTRGMLPKITDHQESSILIQVCHPDPEMLLEKVSRDNGTSWLHRSSACQAGS